MYLRFIAPAKPGGYTVTRSNVAPGLFGPAYDLWWERKELTPALIGIRRELDWFNANLPAPKRLGVKSKGRWYRDGVCWFRDNAREMLRHAYTLAALIEESGVRIDRVRSRDPGQILYRDDWQIVAKPDRFDPARLQVIRSNFRPTLRRFGGWVGHHIRRRTMPKHRNYENEPSFRTDIETA